MRNLLNRLLFVLALTIIAYSALETGIPNMFSSQARTCCTYQEDCPDNQTCKTIFPECSHQNKHICQASLDVE
jgi:hypothetical protein